METKCDQRTKLIQEIRNTNHVLNMPWLWALEASQRFCSEKNTKTGKAFELRVDEKAKLLPEEDVLK